jgi:hypothetical protein
LGRDNVVGISTYYGLNGRGSNPGGSEIFLTDPNLPWARPTSHKLGTVLFPEQSGRVMALTTHPDLALRLKKE